MVAATLVNYLLQVTPRDTLRIYALTFIDLFLFLLYMLILSFFLCLFLPACFTAFSFLAFLFSFRVFYPFLVCFFVFPSVLFMLLMTLGLLPFLFFFPFSSSSSSSCSPLFVPVISCLKSLNASVLCLLSLARSFFLRCGPPFLSLLAFHETYETGDGRSTWHGCLKSRPLDRYLHLGAKPGASLFQTSNRQQGNTFETKMQSGQGRGMERRSSL